MANKTLGFKVPEEWIPEIDRIAKEQGLEKSEACRIAIAQYFGFEYNQAESKKVEVSEDAITALTAALLQLTDRVEKIEENIKPATNIYKFPTDRRTRSQPQQSPLTTQQSPVNQQLITNNQPPITDKKLNAIARRAEQCGMSLEEAVKFAPWLIGFLNS